MNRMLAFAGIGVLWTSGAVASPPHDDHGHGNNEGPEITVMTQNQYLGTDLTPIIAAPDAAAFNDALIVGLTQIAENNTPERAEALAETILSRDPHLVGLQEMFAFTCIDLAPVPQGLGCTDPQIAGAFNDHLQLTLDALGGAYYSAGEVKNLDLSTIQLPGLPSGIPFYINGIPALLGTIDRDVVLARQDVVATPVPIPCARPSVDGCNFQAVASAISPVGPIAIERGFLMVDAWVDGNPYRLINTHLEVPDLDPNNALGAAYQAYQAQELLATVAAVPSYPGTETIILGDFNSSPEHEVIYGVCAEDFSQTCNVDADCGTLCAPVGPIVPPYTQLALSGYADAWDYRPGNSPGHTCCQAEDLRNEESMAFERIDLIFTANPPSDVKANVLGFDEEDKTASGMWQSDHATVVGDITF